ncbi:putative secreted protein [Hasllibacter halocynthiae]|uniref:Putative secreted protein n=1 Tax=Hasllibacter halocynthiae TaxID=595589 RepID=A0A2T0X0Z4_9RHOB|nr:DUF1467 family protein [Hasllibacter halocynthiae]PRY92565.1 putative secreted protein [Hasllibacter halocynthiae]
MGITSALVLLAVIWFMTLFVVLVIGLETQGDRGMKIRGTSAGSPEDPRMGRRFLRTTIWAVAIWVPACALILSGWVGVEDFDLFSRFGLAGEPWPGD